MELGLSLGDASKPFDLLENKSRSIKKRGFCMALGINSHKLEENYHDDETALHLNLLPIRISSLPCSSDYNGSSENGSSGNMGPAAANRPTEASSANSVGSMDLGIYLRNINQNVVTGNDVVEGERASSRASDDDENGLSNRKKLRLSKQQSASLEQSFKENNTLNPKEKVALAKQLNLRARQVEVWFQNRRARTKLKQTEVDCDYLKRCCETLTEENRGLQKELQELRALKTSSNNPLYMQLPATTLTMCPSCERVSTAAPPPAQTTFPFPVNRARFFPFSQIPNQPTPTNQSFSNI